MADYHPRFVTETDERYWTDCTWASAVMFIDAWTLGYIRVDRERLRTASGDTVGGSNLDDVARGMARLLPQLPSLYRPGDWSASDAVAYLRDGGVLIAQGLYSSIRSYDDGRYTRWDPTFAASGSKSGHAVCVSGYSTRDGVPYVYWQDPLGRGTYTGEWVPATVLVWFLNSLRRSNGSVRVAAAKVGAAAPLPETSTETMSLYQYIAQGGTFTIPAGKTVRAYKPGSSDWVVVKTWADHGASSGTFKAHLHRMGGTTTPSVLLHCNSGFFDGLYISTADVVETIVLPKDDSPYTQAQMDAAVAAAKAEQEAALAAANTAAAAAKAKLANALQKAKDVVTALQP